MKIKLRTVVFPAVAFVFGVVCSSMMSSLLVAPPPPVTQAVAVADEPAHVIEDEPLDDKHAASPVPLPANFIDARSKAVFYGGLGVLAAREYLKGKATADTAMQHLLDAVTADQDYAEAWLCLGLLQAMERDSDRALQLFHKVLDLEPNNFAAQLHVAVQHEVRGEFELAKTMFHKIYVDRLPETHIAQYFYDVQSPWLDADVKGKQLNTPEYIKKMNEFVVDVLAIAHFEPNLYAYRTRDESFESAQAVLLDKLIPPIMLSRIQRYYAWLDQSGAHTRDALPAHPAALRSVAVNERMGRVLSGVLSPYIANVLGRPVKPAYSFVAVYSDAAELSAHKDAEQCEYTLSISVDKSALAPAWPLFVCKAKLTDACTGNEHVFATALGDAVLYRGRFHTHRREKLPPNTKVTQLLLHFVNIDYRGGLLPGGKATAGVPTE